jgi:hypothetical protein
MTANTLHTARPGSGLRRDRNILRVSSPHRNCFAVKVIPQSRLTHSPLPGAPRAVGSENAHPGPAVWVPVLILFALTVAAYFLFIAKATGTWPFG